MDMNDIRLLNLTGMDHGVGLIFAIPGAKSTWKDGEDFITFAEHADEFQGYTTGSQSVFFRIYAFGKTPGWMPSPDIFRLIDES